MIKGTSERERVREIHLVGVYTDSSMNGNTYYLHRRRRNGCRRNAALRTLNMRQMRRCASYFNFFFFFLIFFPLFSLLLLGIRLYYPRVREASALPFLNSNKKVRCIRNKLNWLLLPVACY